MLEIVIFNPKNNEAINNALRLSSGTTRIVSNLNHQETKYRNTACIMLCLDATTDENKLRDLIPELQNFLKKNNINKNVPIIPILYGVWSGSPRALQWGQDNTITSNSQINFINLGLIWVVNESEANFKQKMRWAIQTHQPKQPVSASINNDDYDYSWKHVAISQLLAVIVAGLLGLVLGPIAGAFLGALVGALMISLVVGLIGTGIGAGLGLIAGPIVGIAATTAVLSFIDPQATKTAQKRTADYQIERDLDEKNALWASFKTNFLAENTQSAMNTRNQKQDNGVTSRSAWWPASAQAHPSFAAAPNSNV